MSALTLYDIEESLSQLLDMRERAEAEGAPPDELEVLDVAIREYFGAQKSKTDSAAGAILAYSDAAEMVQREADRLAERAKQLAARAERIKSNALRAMQAHGVTLLETPTHTLRVWGNGGAVPFEVTEPRLVPADLFRYRLPELTHSQWQMLMALTSGGNRAREEFREHLMRFAAAEPNPHAIRVALNQRVPCEECENGQVDRFDNENGHQLHRCGNCGGKGTIPNTVPGARLLERGEHLRVS